MATTGRLRALSRGELEVWRFYLLKGYALVVGAGLFVLGIVGLLGFTSYFFIPPPAEVADNLLHISTGLIFIGAWWVIDGLGNMRTFLGGMGLMLVMGKILILGSRTIDLGFLTIDLVGLVCLVAGVGSLLIALVVGRGPSI